MDHGWSLKKLHRLIVTSATYRQSSQRHAGAATRSDPYNRLLARGPRFRVEAEIVRDIALAASGLLNPKVGGPSVYPPAPAFLFQPPASYAPEDLDRIDRAPTAIAARSTRSAIRSVPYPMLQTFDAPNGDIVLRAPRALEHAAAGADDAERAAVRRIRPGAWRCARSARRRRDRCRPRRPTPSAAASRARRRRDEADVLLQLLGKEDAAASPTAG